MPASAARPSASRIVVSLFTIVVLISAVVAPVTVFATVGTDQADYSPGSVVTISGDNSNGAGYVPGETVSVQVSGPNGYTATCQGTADANGAWSCQVTLWDTALALGTYTYRATGQTSGVTETGTFSDNISVGITGSAGWFNASPVSLSLAGTYTCNTSGNGSVGCTGASLVIEVRDSDGVNNSATGTIRFSSAASPLAGSASNANWTKTITPGALADGLYDLTATLTISSGTGSGTQTTSVDDNYFGVDTARPTSAISTVTGGTLPSATGSATDPGSTSPAPNFSGFDNSDSPKPVHVEIHTNPADALVAGSGQDLSLTGLGTTKQSGTWSYTYAGGPLTPGVGYCVVAKATDHAGNVQSAVTKSCFVVPSPDATAPTTTISLTPASPNGSDGWYTSSVNVATSATDPDDSVSQTRCVLDPASPPATFYDLPNSCAYTGAGAPVSSDGMHAFYVASVDGHGNKESVKSATFKLDKTAPTIAFDHQSPIANGDGWNNTDVTLYWNCSDATSGAVSGTVSQTISTSGANQSATGTCTDKVGNTASDTHDGVNIDKVGPSIAFDHQTPAANGNGWNNSDVTLYWNCTAGVAPVVSAQISKTLSSEGANQSATGTCTDLAGNTASSLHGGVNIDKTAPTISDLGSTTAANGNGWYKTDVTNTFSASDSLSGLNATCAAAFAATGNTEAKTTSGEGSALTVASDGCTDLAGNTATGLTSASFAVDKTAPTLAYSSASGTGGANNWYISKVTATFTTTDNLSGFAGHANPYPVTQDSGTSEGSAIVINSGTVTDLAGNTATSVNSPPFMIDLTDPVITFDNAAPAPDANNWNNSNVTLTWDCSDGVSGPVSTTVSELISSEGKNLSAKGTCTDIAGRTASHTDGSVNLDKTAPVVTYVANSANGTAGSSPWYISPVTVTFSASDGLSGFVSQNDPYDFQVSSGEHEEGSAVTISSGTVMDQAGNTSNSATSPSFHIDLTDPTNLAFVGGPAAGGSYYYGSVPAAPTCTAQDAVSGLANCLVTGYGTAVGSYTMVATATDNAGRQTMITRSYTVLAWTLKGFYAPVDPNPWVWNTVKGGSTVPLKFNIYAGSSTFTDTSDIQSFTAVAVSCPNSTAATDPVDFTTTGGTTLRWDSTAQQFIQNWQTPKKPGVCVKVTMTTQDDSSLAGLFILK